MTELSGHLLLSVSGHDAHASEVSKYNRDVLLVLRESCELGDLLGSFSLLGANKVEILSEGLKEVFFLVCLDFLEGYEPLWLVGLAHLEPSDKERGTRVDS